MNVTYFSDEGDARRYLGEVLKLWSVWLVGLAGLFLTDGGVRIAVGVVLIVAVLAAMRPLQARAQRLGGDTALDDARVVEQVRGRGLQRDRLLRNLAYGTDPFREALERTGRDTRLAFLPMLIVALTVVVFVFVWFLPGGRS